MLHVYCIFVCIINRFCNNNNDNDTNDDDDDDNDDNNQWKLLPHIYIFISSNIKHRSTFGRFIQTFLLCTFHILNSLTTYCFPGYNVHSYTEFLKNLLFPRLRCPRLKSFTLSDGEYYEMVKSNFERADRMKVVRTTTNYQTSLVSLLHCYNDLLFN